MSPVTHTGAVLAATSDDSVLGSALPPGSLVLVTGGAGFIGSTLAIELRRAGARVIALDNLRRPGSEINVQRLHAEGVEVIRGDVRVADDLQPAEAGLQLIVDCAADPSVLSGYNTPPSTLVGNNLLGTANCLELARRTGAAFVFLSTSRVYPVAALNDVPFIETSSRFEFDPRAERPGVSPEGINEEFPLNGTRSLYGATKLASELLVQEYATMFGFKHVINRLGVIVGPWQMGRVEQGVFTLWLARHVFGGDLQYRGWGGHGKQIRDLLHVSDLWELLKQQLRNWESVNGRIYNVGGGRANTVSLVELTTLCRDLTGKAIIVGSEPATHPSDIRAYYTDNRLVTEHTRWRPSRDVPQMFGDILQWLRQQEAVTRPLFTS